MPIARSVIGRNLVNGGRQPAMGAHSGDWDIAGSGSSPQGVTIDTAADGSSLLVFTLGEFANYGTPTDNKGNTLSLLRDSAYYDLWTGYGMEVYARANMAGGSSHTTQVSKTSGADESTLIVVEAIRARTIQDSSIVARQGAGAGVGYASAAVVATGPALLVSCWGGDGGLIADQSAYPDAGWTMVESLFLGGTAYIQAAVAYKYVPSAGSYTCSWTPTLNQGGIVFLAALQA